MTDNTQELDYTHPDEMPTVEHKPSPSSDLRGMIVHFTSEMLDSPNDYGIYPTTNFYNDLEEAILDWHNKQVGAELEALLDEIKHEDLRTISQVITARIDKLKEEEI